MPNFVKLPSVPWTVKREVPLNFEIGVDCFRRAEQLQNLIDEMRAEVVPDTAAGTGLFAPTLARLRAITVIVRFEKSDVAQGAFGNEFSQSEVIAVPATALKSGEQLSAFAGQFNQHGP